MHSQRKREWFDIDEFWREFHHTIYSAQALRDRLADAGFKQTRVYGRLDGSEYGSDAPRLVVVGRR